MNFVQRGRAHAIKENVELVSQATEKEKRKGKTNKRYTGSAADLKNGKQKKKKKKKKKKTTTQLYNLLTRIHTNVNRSS